MVFDFSRHIWSAGQSLVRLSPLGGAPSPCGLTYLSKPARGDIGLDYKANKVILPFFHDNFLFVSISSIIGLHPRYYDYFDKLLRLKNCNVRDS